MCIIFVNYLSDVLGRYSAVVWTTAHAGNISADFDTVVQSSGHYIFEPFQALGNATANVLSTKPFRSRPEDGDFFDVVLHLKTISKH